MKKLDGEGETRFYLILAIVIIIIVFITIFIHNNNLELANIHHDVLGTSWFEDIEKREITSKFFGFEKYGSITYISIGNFPSYLIVSTIKSPVMLNKKDLRDNIEKSLTNYEGEIVIDNQSNFSGNRFIKNGHTTLFIIYNGTDVSKYPNEKIKVIGEVWNCGKSGTSIICLGFAHITDNANNNSKINTTHWEKIIGDEVGTFGLEGFKREDGLIFNVICH